MPEFPLSLLLPAHLRDSTLTNINAAALVPEHLNCYSRVMSGQSPQVMVCQACEHVEGDQQHSLLLFRSEKSSVLVAQAMGIPNNRLAGNSLATEPPVSQANLAKALALLCAQAKPGESFTLLAQGLPRPLPMNAQVQHDSYWFLPLDVYSLNSLPQKVRHMIHRADLANLRLGKQDFGPAHQSLIQSYQRRVELLPGTRHIFSKVEEYSRCQGVQLFSAWGQERGEEQLLAFAVADYSPLSTAFYMFAFRRAHSLPGLAEWLLHHICVEGQLQGHTWLNLGLGINDSLRFFKQKWGARPLLPQVEVFWKPEVAFRGSIWRRISRLFGSKTHSELTR